MGQLVLVMPVLPGQSEAWRRYAQELMGSRRQELDQACARWKISRLSVWITRDRPAPVTVAEIAMAGDIFDTIEQFVRSQDPFDRWLRQQADALRGITLDYSVVRFRAEHVFDWPT